jgi:hypothetical protein
MPATTCRFVQGRESMIRDLLDLSISMVHEREQLRGRIGSTS